MNGMAVFAIVSRLVIGTGTAKIVGAISANALKNVTGINKVCGMIASYAIGSYIGSKASDSFISTVEQIVKKIKEGGENNSEHEPTIEQSRIEESGTAEFSGAAES